MILRAMMRGIAARKRLEEVACEVIHDAVAQPVEVRSVEGGVIKEIVVEGIVTQKGLVKSYHFRSNVDNIELYVFMASKQVGEQQYALFAMDTFLKRQRPFVRQPPDRKWRAERVVQLFSPPTHDWVPPKSFATDQDEYKFDIRPDCTYC